MKYEFIDLKKQYEILGEEIRAGINDVLTSARYINGPQVGELEKALSEYMGVKETVACGNGTASMEMALMALNVGPGDAVFCPAFTFIATAEVAALRGARPIFVDIDPRTYNLDPQDLENKIIEVKRRGNFRPRGVIPVDLFGLPADYPAIEALAQKYELFVLEDAAQGFGGRIGQMTAGSFGLIGSTSFFPAKPLGCYGDGGAVMCKEPIIAQRLRSIRAHGAGGHKYEHVRLGTNSRLDTVQAAVLLVKLRAFPGELIERQRVAARYSLNLKSCLVTPFVPEGYFSSWAQYTVRVPAGRREALMAALAERGVPTMIYYPKPLHLQPAFADLGGREGDLPHSEQASREVLSLPMHPYLTDAEVDAISADLLDILGD